jgi:protein-S-isoprenylcysteine O-methyltransferase Ste14
MTPVIRRVLQLLVLVLLQAAALFVSAGTFAWPAGWWYLFLYVFMLGVGSIYLFPAHKDVVEERSKGVRGGKRWDLLLTRLMILPTFGLLILAGLDERFGWTAPLPVWLRIVGGMLFLIGYILVLWAMHANRFFSQSVRIQTERGHVAVTDGPYRLVRHPGYLGMTTSLAGAVFLLDSLYGLACLLFYLIVIVIRTNLEDRTLLDELPGYREFTARTRYRLLPGLW